MKSSKTDVVGVNVEGEASLRRSVLAVGISRKSLAYMRQKSLRDENVGQEASRWKPKALRILGIS